MHCSVTVVIWTVPWWLLASLSCPAYGISTCLCRLFNHATVYCWLLDIVQIDVFQGRKWYGRKLCWMSLKFYVFSELWAKIIGANFRRLWIVWLQNKTRARVYKTVYLLLHFLWFQDSDKVIHRDPHHCGGRGSADGFLPQTSNSHAEQVACISVCCWPSIFTGCLYAHNLRKMTVFLSGWKGT